ncbi:Uncharacterised protein [Vibrio cholerae]|nr:Uncharacterised protein [Vibrio cholerae]
MAGQKVNRAIRKIMANTIQLTPSRYHLYSSIVIGMRL